MISQRCPKCFSKRIRRGYRPTPLWSKILFRYNLLCDSCNWEFTGFAVPGTVTSKPVRKHKKTRQNKEEENLVGTDSKAAAPSNSSFDLAPNNSGDAMASEPVRVNKAKARNK